MRRLHGICHWTVRVVLVWAVAVATMNCAGAGALRQSAERPRDPETGILVGAESITIDRGRDRACLLLHGWVSAPADFGHLPGDLDEAGWDVYAPLHVGHGTHPGDLQGVTAQDLLAAPRAHYRELRGRYDRVALLGFSMGSTISIIMAADEEVSPDAVVMISPYFGVTHKWYYILPPRLWHTISSPFIRYVVRPTYMTKVNRPEGRDEVFTYAAFPSSAATALFDLGRTAVKETDLSKVTAPALMVYSAGDEAAYPGATERVYERLPEGIRQRFICPRSNHQLMQDHDREDAARAIVSFLRTTDEHADPP